MTPQEIFDKVATHLLTQNHKAQTLLADTNGDSSLACAYRSYDGRSCAVGCLIPDDMYDPAIEGTSIDYWPTKKHTEEFRLKFVDLIKNETDTGEQIQSKFDLLKVLQHVHDHNDTSLWRVKLHRVAKQFKLSTSVLESFQNTEHQTDLETMQ